METRPLLLRSAELIFQSEGQQPLAATLVMTRAGDGAADPSGANFDWRHKGKECWNIEIATSAGKRLVLSDGGATLSIDGGTPFKSGVGEYPALYERFATLIKSGQSQVDAEPLRLIADAFLLARRCA